MPYFVIIPVPFICPKNQFKIAEFNKLNIVYRSVYYNDLVLQSQTLKALSSKPALPEITNFFMKLNFLVCLLFLELLKVNEIIFLIFKLENIDVSKVTKVTKYPFNIR